MIATRKFDLPVHVRDQFLRKNRMPILAALSIANGELKVVEIQILDAKAQAFCKLQAACRYHITCWQSASVVHPWCPVLS